MKTILQIIDETAAAYTLSTRAIIKGTDQCVYQTIEGRCCAVGRCMEDPLDIIMRLKPHMDSGVFDIAKLFGSLDVTLKPEYRGHPEVFWVHLQGFHDCNEFWCEEGLSAAGEEQVNRLKAKWSPK